MEKDCVMQNRLRKLSKEREANSKERQKRISKDRIKANIKKKIQTTGIGALSKVENFFGQLWGQGLDEQDCTDEQLDKYDVWQQCRDEILNLMNAQIRALDKEFEYYEVEYKGNQAKFFPSDECNDASKGWR